MFPGPAIARAYLVPARLSPSICEGLLFSSAKEKNQKKNPRGTARRSAKNRRAITVREERRSSRPAVRRSLRPPPDRRMEASCPSSQSRGQLASIRRSGWLGVVCGLHSNTGPLGAAAGKMPCLPFRSVPLRCTPLHCRHGIFGWRRLPLGRGAQTGFFHRQSGGGSGRLPR
jgi:hypothetical protein